MKTQLKPMLIFVTATLGIFSGCQKQEGIYTTIKQVSLTLNKDNTETGTFTSKGGVNTKGTFIMDVQYVGTDSFYCLNKLISDDGTFTTRMKCSMITNTGAWYVIGGTGKYKLLEGRGNLVMSYPEGIVGVKVLTGKVFPNGSW